MSNFSKPFPQDKWLDEAQRLRYRVKRLEAILQFAYNNKDKFTEYDPDGVKKNWIDAVEDVLDEE